MLRMLRSAIFVLAAFALTGCTIVPDAPNQPGRQTARQSMRPAQPTYSASAGDRQCYARLDAAQARFSSLPDQYYGAGCSTLGAVQLSELHSDNAMLTLSNLGPVACGLATTFAGWARFGVDRAARVVFGSPLARIETMGSYSCRTVAGSDRLSAHATANAIDVSAFVLANGKRVSVKDGWDSASAKEREFLRIIHESACKRFGTVLGPDYNSAHENHFHLESSGNSYCR